MAARVRIPLGVHLTVNPRYNSSAGTETGAGATAWQRHLPDGVDPQSVDLAAGGTLPAIWHANWMAAPDRPVLYDPAHGWVTGGQLASSVERCATQLSELGTATGDRVLLGAPNCVELVIAHAALLSLGALVVPLNHLYQRDEVVRIARATRPTAALVRDPDWSVWITDTVGSGDADVVDSGNAGTVGSGDADAVTVVPDWDEIASLVTTPVSTPAPNPTTVEEQDQHTQPSVSTPAPNPTDPALLMFTSGTTGNPKAALLSHANLLASVRAIELAWRWTHDDVLVLTLPLSHMHGLGVGLYGALTAGSKLVLHDGFDADAVLDAIDAHDATMFFGVPITYGRLLDSARVERMSVLRLCVSGSAPLPAQVHHRFAELTGQLVLERYGMTETVMLVSNPHDGERRPGTVGFPLPGVELRLAADSGEIQVRGPSVFNGYWQIDKSIASSGDGWFSTGDLGEISDDGYVSIVGRCKDVIISGGYNVHPLEVEEAISHHPAVAECAVVGEPDPQWGEVVTAYVVPAGGCQGVVDRAVLRVFLKTHLAGYKCPKRVYEIDKLPRNALGKVQRNQLRETQ